MIPKKLHYIWFSDNQDLPETVTEYIHSWKRAMPDYELILWNENNFCIEDAPLYIKEAYREKKYAFVSDYVRLWVLYNFGGIYMDTDVEVYKSFSHLLDKKAFTGFEDSNKIGAWLLASEPRNGLFLEFMNDYEDRRFVLGEGKYDLTPNIFPITKRLIMKGLVLDGSYQELNEITIFPTDYFCPFNPYRNSKDCFTENTICCHHFDGAWLKIKNEKEQQYIKDEEKYIKLFGNSIGKFLHKFINMSQYLGLLGIFKYVIWRRKK